MVTLAVVAVFLLCASSLALDPDFIRQIESRTELEWQALWTEERLALCRAKLRENLDAICGKDVFRRSSHAGLRRDKRDKDRDGSEPLEPTEVPRVIPSSPDTGQTPEKRRSPFLSVQQANLFVTTWVHDQGGRRRGRSHYRRRRQSPSITTECCTVAGCTWEEYAEYCPSSNRARLL
ncbi:probable insulin-like peptide 7 [Penaeus japonicus]|uniref:probable insulin-like peptide 7 n=1 Tax=Penaeus japonicus TaxID=27405 RepID=UPI001C714144|nr:probable insulin-like peptide 7 [Penaeus japonicus]